MKGGKQGRKRRSASGGAARKPSGRSGATRGGAKQPRSSAPKKGDTEKRQFGGMRTSGDD